MFQSPETSFGAQERPFAETEQAPRIRISNEAAMLIINQAAHEQGKILAEMLRILESGQKLQTPSGALLSRLNDGRFNLESQSGPSGSDLKAELAWLKQFAPKESPQARPAADLEEMNNDDDVPFHGVRKQAQFENDQDFAARPRGNDETFYRVNKKKGRNNKLSGT
jgi:hypothetical protein